MASKPAKSGDLKPLVKCVPCRELSNMGGCLKTLAGQGKVDKPLEQGKKVDGPDLPPTERQQSVPFSRPQEVPRTTSHVRSSVRASLQPITSSQSPEEVFTLYAKGKDTLQLEDAVVFFQLLQFPLDQGDGFIAFYLLQAESFEAVTAVQVQRYCRE